MIAALTTIRIANIPSSVPSCNLEGLRRRVCVTIAPSPHSKNPLHGSAKPCVDKKDLRTGPKDSPQFAKKFGRGNLPL